MPEPRSPFDATFKDLFQTGPKRLLQRLGIEGPFQRLSGELGYGRRLRADWLSRTPSGLVHVEFQTTNDPRMNWRMIEYLVEIHATYGLVPVQHVIYAGTAGLRMNSTLETPSLQYSFGLTDIRDISAEFLLDSEQPEDNVLAILGALKDPAATARRIVNSIRRRPARYEALLSQLMVLLQLRGLSPALAEEQQSMPFTLDLSKNPYFGKQVVKMYEEAKAAGLAEGETAGNRAIVRRLLEKKFGNLPRTAVRKLEAADSSELEAIGLRLLDAKSLKEALG